MRNFAILGFACSALIACSASTSGHDQQGDPNGGSGNHAGAEAGGSAGSSGAGGAAGAAGAGGFAGSAAGDSSTGGSAGAASSGGGGSAGTGGTISLTRDGGRGFDPDTVPNSSGLLQSPKLDLLIVVDNSLSMGDKQAALAKSIPDLVARIASPASGIRDLHVGVITSSIGGHGSTLCMGSDTGTLTDQEENDHGYLIAKRPRFPASMPGALQPTPDGFLEWNSSIDVAELRSGIEEMVVAAGEFGCGLESQLEAAYRFLVDPRPYLTITTENCAGTMESCAVPSGLDEKLLAQRRAFLRPDSVVAVVELTDENDCSIRESGQYYYAARDSIILPHGSAACDANPNDKCCYSCASATPDGCTADPACSTLPSAKDPANLRCYHEKQRFGFDFLYPTARYVNALSRTELCLSRADLLPAKDCPDADGDGNPDLVHNPLFWSAQSGDAAPTIVRDPSIVYLLGIVGVPYQDLQATQDPARIDYRTPSKLVATKTWDKILGDETPPDGGPPILPSDTLLVESLDPRTGMDGETPPSPLSGSGAGYLANPVNGHEWLNPNQDDLQYACIFPLTASRDCAVLAQQTPTPGCDCNPGTETDDNPLCENPAGVYTTVQGFAKAYPPLRELEVIRALGDNGLVSSICSRNVSDDSRQDYAYRPATDLLLNQIRHSAPP